MTDDPSALVPADPSIEFDAGEAFGENERTVVSSAPFELRSTYAGRRPALAQLEQRLAEALTGAAADGQNFVIVVADAGMGKSRTVGELAIAVAARVGDVAQLAGNAEGVIEPYAAVAQGLAQHLELRHDATPAVHQAQILRAVAEVLPGARSAEVAHLLAHLLGCPFADSPVVTPLKDSPSRLEAMTFLALRRYLTAICARQPVVMVLENLDQAGAETINLIKYLAAGMTGKPFALLATATAALFTRHPGIAAGDGGPERIDLAPLTPAEAEGLVRELLAPVAQLPARILSHARALSGSPRAIHELVRLLLETECIVRSSHHAWVVNDSKLAQQVLPRTYDELVAARLGAMDAPHRRTLEMAAAVGHHCWLEVIVAIDRTTSSTVRDPDGPTLAEIAASGDASRLRVVAALNVLIEREWLVEVARSSVPGEREFRFAYPHLWSLVDRGIADGARRDYHLTVARWLLLRADGQAPEALGPASGSSSDTTRNTIDEDIARHLERGGELLEAGGFYQRAGNHARVHYANARAIALYDRALACLAEGDVTRRIQIWHDLGSIYDLTGDAESALGAFERMLRLSWLVASKTKAAVAFNKMGRVWRRKGHLTLALEYLGRGLELFDSADDARGVAGSQDDIGRVLYLQGRYDEALAKVREALGRRRKAGEPRAIAASLSNLGQLQHARGDFDGAQASYHEALSLRVRAGDRGGQVTSRHHLAGLAFDREDFAEARAGWLAALTEAEAIGAAPQLGLALIQLGNLALREQKLTEAKSRLADAHAVLDDIEDQQLDAEVARLNAVLELAHGHQAPALAHAKRALDIAKQTGIREAEALAHATLGQVRAANLYDADAAASSDAPTADDHFLAATQVLRDIGHQLELARVETQFGRYLLERGQLGAGKERLRAALAVFATFGLSRQAHDVEQLLAAVTG